MSCKVGLYAIVFKALLCSSQSFPSSNCAIDAWEEFNTLLHECWNESFDLILIFDDCLNAFLVECKASCYVFKHSYKVNDKSTLLVLIVCSIGAADSLKKGVILHWLVQVHALENWRIKSCEQLTSYNHELERGEWVAELI